MYKIFERLILTKGVTPYFVSKETGISYSTLSNWKFGHSHPRDDKMELIADFLGVSLAYLKGQEKDMQCPECHMRYKPAETASYAQHMQYHKQFTEIEKKYGRSIPSKEDVEQARTDALMILRDISFDKFRRISAFNDYALNDYLLTLHETNFEYKVSLDQHAKELAEKFRPDRGISLDLCNAIRAELGVDAYEEDLSAKITEKEYQHICRYRKLPEVLQKAIDAIMEANYEAH